MALYKTRQLLANYSQQSVRDLSVSRLEKLYAPVVAQRRQADLDNEQAFEMNIPHLEHVKHLLAQELEQMATEENAHMPVSSYFDAIQVAKAARVSENDIGCRALITMLENTWKRDRTASLSAAKYVTLTDHFRKNYPRSAVCEVLEKIGESGYMTLECSRLAEIASDIGSQEDYERVILENGLQSNSPNCKKARQFILALVNGDDERPFERTSPRTAEKYPGDVQFDIRVEQEDEHPEGNASAIDEDTDNEVLNWIKEQREIGNEWAWCQVQIVASWTDDEGNEYNGESSWLGGCSYESEETFVNDGGEGYYSDLKDEAFDDLMKNVEKSEFGQKTMNWTSKKAQAQNELNYGFAIIDGFMEDADDDEHPHSSTLDSEGITQAAMQIERNMLRWLNKNVGNARDEGHDSRDDLVGSIFVEKGSEGHQFILDAIEAGEPMSFGGYSNLPFDATDGVDEKYAWYFTPGLEFFDGPEEESEDPDEDLV